MKASETASPVTDSNSPSQKVDVSPAKNNRRQWARRFGVLHGAVVVLVGCAGWWLALSTLDRSTLAVASAEALTFVITLLIARVLTLRIHGNYRIALDSSIYIAGSFVWGPSFVSLAMGLVLAVSVAAEYRWRQTKSNDRDVWFDVAEWLFRSGGALLVYRLAIGVSVLTPLAQSSELQLFGEIIILSVSFLGGHYVLTGLVALLSGMSANFMMLRFLPRSMGAELTLIPLTYAMTLAYKYQGPLLYFLISGTGLMFAAIFSRWNRSQSVLQDRLRELQAINRIGRLISASFDRYTLFKNLSQEVVALFDRKAHMIVGLLNERRDGWEVQSYDAEGERVVRTSLVANHRFLDAVIDAEHGLISDSVPFAKSLRQQIGSWMSMPLRIYGESAGFIALSTERQDAFRTQNLEALATITDQVAIGLENSKLYKMATIDALTGLFVRRYFEQRVVEEWHRSDRYQAPLTLGLVDLDRFKMLNDTYGHPMGDRVLRAVGRVLRDNMRSFDLAARYGGEELVFMLPRTKVSEGVCVAERIRSDVEALAFSTSDGEVVRTTVSIGLAGVPEHGLQSTDQLIVAADKALYRAKHGGRNNIVVYSAQQSKADWVEKSAQL